MMSEVQLAVFFFLEVYRVIVRRIIDGIFALMKFSVNISSMYLGLTQT